MYLRLPILMMRTVESSEMSEHVHLIKRTWRHIPENSNLSYTSNHHAEIKCQLHILTTMHGQNHIKSVTTMFIQETYPYTQKATICLSVVVYTCIRSHGSL